VDKLKWCTYYVFAEMLMLGQCIPGPTSTQMSFALGVLKKGLSGGALSGILFQGPGLLILSILGWAASEVLDKDLEWLNGIVAGLAAAGIALVASASVGLSRNICKGKLLQVISTTCAVVAYYYPKPWTFPSLIVLGGLATIILKRKETINVAEANVGVEKLGFNKLGGGLLIVGWVVILVVTVVLAGQISYDDSQELHWFAAFYRTGSVIFGGGQVVLPMLYNDVVAADCADQQYRCCATSEALATYGNDTSVVDCTSDSTAAASDPNCTCSWMSGNEFYAGLALAQAMPGPLFNFAAYLGAVIALNAGTAALAGIALCWIALFAPGIILIFGILPFWGAFRKWQVYRR
jgi:chromate transporter